MKRWNNSSIQKKMMAALCVCVIIPIMFLGAFTAGKVLDLNRQIQYDNHIKLLDKLGRELETVYRSVEQQSKYLTENRSVQAIAEKKASVRDYQLASNQLLTSVKGIPGCVAITISKQGDILFQRGERYLGEQETKEYTSRIEGNRDQTLWPVLQTVTNVKGSNKKKLSVVSAYVQLNNKISLRQTGTLGIYLDREQLTDIFREYLMDDLLVDAFVVDAKGNLILSCDLSDYTKQQQYIKWIPAINNKQEGYLEERSGTGRYDVIYRQCGDTDWYLVQVKQQYMYMDNQVIFMIAVVVLCILFGLVYGYIQHTTIILPLRHLSKRMDTVKSGILKEEIYDMPKNEIGNVEAGFEDMVTHVNQLIEQVYMQTIKTQEAERKMLLTQMNPHFLYNSLDSIHWLAYRNKDYVVSEQLEALADVYRHILKSGTGKIHIYEELEFIENYIIILEAGIGDKVKFIVDIPEHMRQYKIPKLMIQPLIENAIQHGFHGNKSNGKIKVKGRLVGNRIELLVMDNGSGTSQSEIRRLLQQEDTEQAFALRNINDRIKLSYGGSPYGLFFYSKENMGTIVKLVLGAETDCETNDC